MREKGEKVESESVAKILSKRERGAAKICARKRGFKSGSVVQIKRES